jgi:hypothetical protein
VPARSSPEWAGTRAQNGTKVTDQVNIRQPTSWDNGLAAVDARSDAEETVVGRLAGLRVLDLGTVYAAPITAMLLGDWECGHHQGRAPKG